MPIPSQPTNLIPRPFASSGTFQVVPDSKITAGRASFKDGFPTETQLPMNQGGIAPNRMDFNGMFNMLSAFAFWQQSGGHFSYHAELNYKQPSIVFHNSRLWWCVASNGPEVSGVGVKTPGSSETYWMELYKALQQMGGGSVESSVPVGAIIYFYGTEAPTGYFACNGNSFSSTIYPKLYALLGKVTLPDLRGYFLRGYDTRNTIDPQGASRIIGSVQQDAMQPITGSADMQSGGSVVSTGGAFYSISDTLPGRDGGGSVTGYPTNICMDSARVTRTSTETRAKNVCLLICIKHD